MNIPSYVVIDGEITALSYYGQKQTCKHCQDYSHNGISCVEDRKLRAQKTSAVTKDTLPESYLSKLTKTKTTLDTSIASNKTDLSPPPRTFAHIRSQHGGTHTSTIFDGGEDDVL